MDGVGIKQASTLYFSLAVVSPTRQHHRLDRVLQNSQAWWDNGLLQETRPVTSLPEGSKINLDGWIERMNWSHIRTLNLESVSPLVVQKLNSVLKELSSLTLDYGNSDAEGAYIDQRCQ
jgi:hypothetical protein